GRSHAAPWKGTQPTWAWCQRVVLLDGEIVCLDHDGRPLFNALLYCRAEPCFVAFDCLSRGGSPPSRTATTSASAQVPALPCRSFVGSHALHSSFAGANRGLNGQLQSNVPGYACGAWSCEKCQALRRQGDG